MLVDHLPAARRIGVGWHPFKQQGSRAVAQRTVNDVGVAGNPADVCSAPVDLTWVIVEYVVMSHGGHQQVTARGVQHALGLAGRA